MLMEGKPRESLITYAEPIEVQPPLLEFIAFLRFPDKPLRSTSRSLAVRRVSDAKIESTFLFLCR
jgi:hypothetical protein